MRYVPFVAITSQSAAKANAGLEQRRLISCQHVFHEVDCLKLKLLDPIEDVRHSFSCARAMDVERIIRGNKGKQVELLPGEPSPSIACSDERHVTNDPRETM